MANLAHRILGTNPNKGLQPKEIISYSIAGLGQNLICAIITAFLLIFFTDAVGLTTASVAYLMLGTRVFDAFNDPFMGSIVDKTRTRWGKLRPYLLFSPIPIAILTVLCFTTLPETATLQNKFIYSAIMYVLWSIAFTIVDVPYWGLSSAMTGDTHKRATLLTVARLFCSLGFGIITIGVPIIQGMVEKNATGGLNISELDAAAQLYYKPIIASALQSMYLWVSIVVVVLAIPTFFIGFYNTKERFYDDSESKSLKHNLMLLTKNKPLLLIVLSGILGGLRLVYMTAGIYFAKYNLGDTSLFTIITVLVLPGGLIASFLTPYLSKKFGKRNLFIYSHIMGAVMLFVLYFVGYQSSFGLIFAVITLLLLGVPSGFSNILTYAMIADTIDYLEHKTGERGEGICFAMQTFISKISMAFCSFAILITLAIYNFDEYVNTVAPPSVQNAIWFTSVFVAAVSMLLTVIPLFFYKYDEKEQERLVKLNNIKKNREI